MKNWKVVAIPTRMKNLQKDRRGYPIPFTIRQNSKGATDFAIHDDDRLTTSIFNKVCSICGQGLDSDIWLIAGAKIALHSNGAYVDPPMHKECGMYALQVCPYLALPSFLKRHNKQKDSNPNIPGKPVVWGFIKTSNYQVHFQTEETFIIPVRPLIEIEFWREGNQIPPNEANRLMNR